MDHDPSTLFNSSVRFVSSKLGVNEAGVKIITTLLLGSPIAIIYNLCIVHRNALTKKLFFITTGFLLGFFIHGYKFLHTTVTILTMYIVLRVFGGCKFSVGFAFTFCTGYLMWGYYFTQTGEYSFEWTIPHCILTLRLIAIAFDVYDGQRLKNKQLDSCGEPIKNEAALTEPPKLLDLFANCYFPFSFMVGPQFEFKRFLEFLNEKENILHLSLPIGLSRFGLGLVYLFFHILGEKYLPILAMESNYFKNPSNIAGLTNLGNTCYMNAILQSLYATEVFREFVNRARRGPVNSALGQLFDEMSSPTNSSVNPSSFRNQFTRIQPKFRGYEQQDAQEFFQYLINALHDEVNTGKFGSSSRNSKSPKSSAEAWERYRKLEDSPYVDMMAGQLSSTVICSICGNASTCWDPFWDLSLPLPNNVRETNTERCLKEFTALEELSRDEYSKCERCDKPTKSTKRLSIEKAPTVLILHLRRFSNDGYKLTRPRVVANERIFAKSKYYSLISVVLHHGSSIRSGHYTAYCQHDSKWFHFNDDRVREVRNFSPNDAEDAYILFYVESSCSSRL